MSTCKAAGTATGVEGSESGKPSSQERLTCNSTLKIMSYILWHLKTRKRGGVSKSRDQPAWAKHGFRTTYKQI